MRLAIGVMALAMLAPGLGAIGADSGKYDRYFDRVRPLLESRCVSCHGPDKQEGGLRLDSPEAIAKGGDGGPVVFAGHPEASPLVRSVRHQGDSPKMPPKERLKDDQVDDLAAWVLEGAVTPAVAQVLIEDDPRIVEALREESGTARLDSDDRIVGSASLIVDGQKSSSRVEGWEFPIREHPGAGEHRYLRFAWRKRGGGALMVEAARDGGWRSQGETNASWVAGPNTTGWPAHEVVDRAPTEWSVVTRDLWRDGGSWGDWSLTGLCVTAIGGGEVCLDSVILGPTIESLDAYAPGRGRPAFTKPKGSDRIGDAWSDPANPIRKIFRGDRLDLWSLRKPTRPALPDGRANHPIDRFLQAELSKRGLEPSAEADRRTLIRRLAFDLTGLPPRPRRSRPTWGTTGPTLMVGWSTGCSPRPGMASVGSLLARRGPIRRHERFRARRIPAQHVAISRLRHPIAQCRQAVRPIPRRATGRRRVEPGPVQSTQDADRVAATGFLRLGTFDSTTSLFTEDVKGRDELMSDLANTTGSAFLGLTMSCCQCHDHKYDPLSQADHYRLRAFFAAVKPKDDEVVSLPAEVETIERHNAEVAGRLGAAESRRKALLEPAARKLEAEKKAKLADDLRALLEIPEEKRDEATRKKLEPALEQLQVKDEEAIAALSEDERGRAEGLTKEVEAIKGEKRLPALASVMTDGGRSAPPTRVSFQGDYTQPREEVEPGIPSAIDPNPSAIESPTTESTGRRLALARWVASPENPWTARVIVNRLWQGHFGRGLVASPNDFGFAGARPTHPELLDWLATELVDRGWSLKQVHRLIVTSAAYRQSSRSDPARSRIDPENRWLWRQEVRQLDADALRDALVSVSGRLLPVDSGPPRWPQVEEQILEAQPAIYEARHGGDDGRLQDWYAGPAELADVRSVFLIQKRSVPVPLLAPFDLPDTTTSCGRRSSTTVSPQALTLLNNPDAIRLTRAFADRVAWAVGPAEGDRVDLAFRLALGRVPDPDERRMCSDLLARHAANHAKVDGESAGRRALADLCRAIVNLNEFLFID